MVNESLSESRIRKWESRLQERGFRVTSPRRAVLRVVAESEKALSPTEIYDLGRLLYDKLGLVTVYRTLEMLADLNLVARVHRADNCHAYVAGLEGHQHLLICEKCGRVEYFSGDNIGNLIRRVEQGSGYEVHNHWLQLFGVCRDCK
jgi:Fur family ferric uptake transcriptional regulator